MAPHFGYIRVSTLDQKTDRQLREVDFGEKGLDKVFTDKISAKDTNRPALQECIAHLREGDTLHVHSIDRLARNLMDLQQLLAQLNDKGVTVHFHKEHLVFTGQNDAMQKLQLQMMGAFAEFERALIRERQKEGIAAAQAKGTHCGRPPSLTSDQRIEIRQRRATGSTPTNLAKEYNVSRGTIYRIV